MYIPNEADVIVLENVTHETLKEGCKECGYRHIVFQACISIEQNSKVFFLNVECPNCDVEYKDIMMVRDLDYQGGIEDDRSIYK
tara:strand:+ start:3479 stop:3730 length:252 start_codon:yes stop_codon:yes gene_type:complete